MREPFSSNAPTPLQQLAAGVVRQALLDATNASLSEATRAQARHFLLDGADGLRFWCDVLNVSVETLRLMAARELDGSRRSRPRFRRAPEAHPRVRRWKRRPTC